MKRIIISGVFIHIIFLFSIFDIYFKSPVVTGIPPREDLTEAPANRLVLFVADGLRADSFFRLNEDNTPKAPYLRSILEKYGTWGISHTRVPTESRPGHVAIIAGLYEDPSAVARGWQENPVHFDSAFNRSRETWCWGSPDILPMFSKGAVYGKVHINYYSSEEEDFSGNKDTALLDEWVFERVESFFNKAKDDSNLYMRLKENKIIFFLHLLGLDTAGHMHKPNSKELDRNLKVVDEGIKRIEAIFQKFYDNDNKTAFIFTSDHGMTDWGSHGSGSAHETETPIVTWGAGISTPKELDITKQIFSPSEWKVNDKFRKDIMQADISPLITTLIGSAVPVNSVGMLPLSYLNASNDYMAKACFHNALQLADQYKYKKILVESDIWNVFKRPFKGLEYNKMDHFIKSVRDAINRHKYDDAIKLSETLMKFSIDGLEYYHTYYQVLLLICISLSFISWILLLSISIFFTNDKQKLFNQNNLVFNLIFGSMIAIATIIIFMQNLPYVMYIYCGMPILLWWAVCRKSLYIFPVLKSKNGFDILKGVGRIIIYIIGAEVMVLSFFYRYVLSICLIFLCIWGCRRLKPLNNLIKIHWIVSSLLLAIFPAMPIVKGYEASNTIVIFLGGLTWIILSIYHCRKPFFVNSIIQTLFLVITLFVVISTRNNFEERLGLSWRNMITSWILLVSSLVYIFTTPLLVTARLNYIGKSLAVPFILLSVGYEPLFLFILFQHMEVWLKLECFISNSTTILDKKKFDDVPVIYTSDVRLTKEDFRRSFFFLFYIMVCFFGTGNIASLSSFDPSWVRCFVAKFSPFLMGGLIIFKTLIPFHFVTCYWYAMNFIRKVPTKKLFIGVLVFSNIMGLHFLFLVRNKGSWLDIGMSISHYVIMQVIVLVLILIFGVAKWLTTVKIFHQTNYYYKRSLECGKRS